MEIQENIKSSGFSLDQFYLDWKEAIVDVFYHNDELRPKLLRAQIELFREDRFIVDFNADEAEKSIWFFRYFFSYKLFRNDKRLELKMLKLCLAAGKFSDRSQVELQKIKEAIPHTIGLLDLTEIFERLFAKYESNRLLTLNFHRLKMEQLAQLIQVLKGGSPKLFFRDDFALSEKEIRVTYLLQDIPYCLKEYEDSDEFFPRMLIYIRLLALDPDQSDFLWDFYRHHTTWERDLNRFEEEFDFWKKCYQFFLDHKDHPQFYGSNQYLDFIIFRKENDLHEFRLYGRTIPNLNELMFAFNSVQHQIYLEEQMKIREAKWLSDPNLINEISYKSQTIEFKELTSSRELIKEGEQMENCLMNYVEDCYRGWSKVFSVRDEGRILFDIEIRNGKVVQAYGRNNEPLNKEFLEILGIWVKMNKLEIKIE
ncbi:MAG: PcfJ domain-containing protein [Crocinitomicaceae bacterium]|nr:PcfJ domain-containing protein [Crocinitomicaceae bacterium]